MSRKEWLDRRSKLGEKLKKITPLQVQSFRTFGNFSIRKRLPNEKINPKAVAFFTGRKG
jgi:nucleoid DNA-binding protein